MSRVPVEPPLRIGDYRGDPRAANADPAPEIQPAAAPNLAARLVQIKAAHNPLLEAATPLLRALADTPLHLDGATAVAAWRALLVSEITAFQQLCDKADIAWKPMTIARYCLCTALDEAANRTRWGDGALWAARSLQVEFEGEAEGGEKFFLLVGRLATDPQAYADVLEVLYRILGLGFEGRYSVAEDGKRHLDRIRQRLLTLLNSVRDPVPLALSPHGQDAQRGRLRMLRAVPVWLSASLAALGLCGMFAWYKYHLLLAQDQLQQRIAAIAVQASPRPVAHLAAFLKDEIAAGLVAVIESGQTSTVVFKGDSMFVAGADDISSTAQPMLDKVAREIARVDGRVNVVGHTDSVPMHSAQFPDNQALSEHRAAAVSAYLQAHGIAASRLSVSGRGDTQPVTGNATPAQRARNRRVEIVVRR